MAKKPKYEAVAEHFHKKGVSFTFEDIIAELYPHMKKTAASNLLYHIKKLPWKYQIESELIPIGNGRRILKIKVVSIVKDSAAPKKGVFSRMFDPRESMSPTLRLALGI